MIISQNNVFAGYDSSVPPSIYWTISDPTTAYATDAGLKALAPGSIVVQVDKLGDSSCPDCNVIEVYVKLVPTPDTVGYDGSADYRPILDNVYWSAVSPVSSSSTFKRMEMGSVVVVDTGSNNIMDQAWIKLTDTGSDAGCTDWYQLPIVFCENTVSGTLAMVIAGTGNTASGNWSFVGGGTDNTASNSDGAVLGGKDNSNAGAQCAIIAGRNNAITGNDTDAVIVGGQWSDVSGQAAVAIGHKVNITHDYAVLINTSPGTNYNSDADKFDSFAPQEFAVRANGGIRIYSSTAETTGMTMAAGASAWVAVSDERTKENIGPLPIEIDIFAAYKKLMIHTYTQGDDLIGAGITAQNFYEAFDWLPHKKVGEMYAINQMERDSVQDAAIKDLVTTVDLLIGTNRMLEARVKYLEGKIDAN